MRKNTVADFEKKFTKSLGCWNWTESVKNERWQYGNLKFQGVLWRAHRLSYTLYVGPIPKGKSVLHKCDNPRCVNPAHLFIGTLAENNLDRAKKFRSCNKLTKEEVLFIRKCGLLQTDLAAKFGISQQTVSDIIRRRHYKHVTDT